MSASTQGTTYRYETDLYTGSHSACRHRFRHCSVAAARALECPKTNFRDGNKEELRIQSRAFLVICEM